MRTIRTACVVAVTTMLACGGDDPVAYDELPAALADARCSYSYRCCDAAELSSQFGGVDPPITDEASCRVSMTALYEGLIGDNPSVASGRLRYDGDVAASCVSGLRGATCGTSRQAFRGIDEACADRAYSEAQPPGASVCVAKLADGALCATSTACLSGYCDDAGRCGVRPTTVTCDGV